MKKVHKLVRNGQKGKGNGGKESNFDRKMVEEEKKLLKMRKLVGKGNNEVNFNKL